MPPPVGGLSAHGWVARRQLADIQDRAGNDTAVRTIQAEQAPSVSVQRVAIPVDFTEILQDDPASSASQRSYVPGEYTQSSRYQLTRSDTGFNALVRIRFKDPSGADIVEGDDRREFGTNICASLVDQWNGKFELVAPLEPLPAATADGVEAPAATDAGVPAPPAPGPSDAGVPAPAGAPAPGPPEPTEVRLPLVFAATPVWEGDEADAEVNLHTVPADPDNDHPIDSGNWYSDMGTAYGDTSAEVIYAHEYGHLLGIPDEYSQGNADMHLRLHAISPTGNTQMGEEMERAGRRQIILDALEPHLRRAIRRVSHAAAAAFRTQRPGLRAQLTEALQSSWSDPGTYLGVMVGLAPHLLSQPRLMRALPDVVGRQTRSNIAFARLSARTIEQQLSNTAITSLLRSVYESAHWAAVQGGSTVDIPIPEGGSVEMRIDTRGVSGADRPLERAARSAARLSTGSARPTTPGSRTRPAVYPSDTLIGQLAGLATEWGTAADLFGAQAAELPSRISAAAAARAAMTPPSVTTVRGLNRYVRGLVQSMSTGTANYAVTRFLDAQIRPLLDSQLQQILTLAGAEPDRHTSVPEGGGTDATPAPPDPALQAAANEMAARAQSIQTRPASVGDTGVHIRFTINSMMGSNHEGTDIRPDNIQGIVDQVNAETNTVLKRAREGTFEARRRGG